MSGETSLNHVREASWGHPFAGQGDATEKNLTRYRENLGLVREEMAGSIALWRGASSRN